MTIEEKRRELFEAWWSSSGMEKFKDTAWAAFNAALDAVVIDLPAVFGDTHHEISGAIDYRCAVRAAIESAGLGLKVNQ